MNSVLFDEVTFFVLAIFVGFEVISKVPTILHTPLMSGTNAIHGIILVGAIFIAAGADFPGPILLGVGAGPPPPPHLVGGVVVTRPPPRRFQSRRRPTT